MTALAALAALDTVLRVIGWIWIVLLVFVAAAVAWWSRSAP